MSDVPDRAWVVGLAVAWVRSGLVIGVLLFAACVIYTARAARRLDPPDT